MVWLVCKSSIILARKGYGKEGLMEETVVWLWADKWVRGPLSEPVERKAFQVEKSVIIKAHLVCGRGFQEVVGSGGWKGGRQKAKL